MTRPPRACAWGVLAAALILVAGGTGCSRDTAEPASRILVGTIYPLTEDNPRASVQAVALRGDRIVAAGGKKDVMRHRGDDTLVVEIPEGQVVLPGLIDSHGHLLSLGVQQHIVDLVGVETYDALIARISKRAAKIPKGEWVLGRGWDQNLWEDKTFPRHDALSKAVPDHPVWLIRVDGHAGLANARALAAAGVNAKSKDPEGGRILRKPGSREPTGVLVDKAMALIAKAVPPLKGEDMLTRVEDALRRCAAAGLTTVHDAGTSPDVEDILRYLAEENRLPVRVYAMRDGRENYEHAMAEPPAPPLFGGRLTARAVKLSLDGALGSRGAALLAPYADDSENTGLPRMTREDFKKACETALAKRYQVAVHAIGDAANHLALDVFEEVFRSVHDPRDLRWRIEHAQIVSPGDIPRFARMSILPSMQPAHATSDMGWAAERLGETRLAGAYAWKKFRQAGCRIPGGSDFPVESENPFHGIYAAITRQGADGQPDGGWLPEERLSREEAFLAYTGWAAYAEFAETKKGALRPGAYADLVIVDRDVMTIPPAALRDTRVLLTVMGGMVVFAGAPAI